MHIAVASQLARQDIHSLIKAVQRPWMIFGFFTDTHITSLTSEVNVTVVFIKAKLWKWTKNVIKLAKLIP